MIDADLPLLRERLLAWYDADRRDLPWRAAPGAPAPDPYHVWLSETMLQQTRVETVRPYFSRWLERFPTLEVLAAAEQQEVLRAWEGLGYYSRARNLHAAAREVAARYGGRVPSEPAAFRALPGVGRYTAGAVMSIAFGREEPIVDGNVRRVFARLADLGEPPDADLWELAGRLVPGPRPGDLNQALMELGATVCTPRSPRCELCPVEGVCAARAAGTAPERPARRRAGPLPHEHRLAALVTDDEERVLIGRRVARSRLGGMWEFPGGVVSGAAAAEDPGTMERLLGIRVEVEGMAGRVDHTFTHVRVSYHPLRCRYLGGAPGSPEYSAFEWVTPGELPDYPLPRAQRRIASFLPAPATVTP